jgi:hypothetical protein
VHVEMGFMRWVVACNVFGLKCILISNGYEWVGYKTNASWGGLKVDF